VHAEETTALSDLEATDAMTIEPAIARERQVTATLIRLADSLVEDFDLVDVLDELARDCVRLLGVTAAGLLLAGPTGELHVMAASSEQTRLLELFQLQREQGPCLDCYHCGEPVSATDLAAQAERWPLFAQAALATGFRSVHALPLRLRQQVLGALNLFGDKPGALSEPAARLGQALADMATITILQERALRESEHVAAQLQTALVTRVVIEQAKGILAERGALTIDDAFQVLRKYARDHNLRLHDVARGIVERNIDAAELLATRRKPPLS
jgi:transcriptional regulator with GAF, ATPase, and Fis domain